MMVVRRDRVRLLNQKIALAKKRFLRGVFKRSQSRAGIPRLEVLCNIMPMRRHIAVEMDLILQ